MLNLDTHILIFALEDQLTNREDRLIRINRWAISDIVFWEIAMLRKKNRIALNIDAEKFHEFFRNCQILAITPEIARISTELDFKLDPADHIIAATSIVHRIPLLTRDAKIRKSKLVPLA